MNVIVKIEEPHFAEIHADWETVRAVVDWLDSSPTSPWQKRAAKVDETPAIIETPHPPGDSVPKQNSPTSPRKALVFPPPGERVIDFVERACRKLGKSRVSPHELLPVMKAEGWHTSSPRPLLVLRSSLRNSKGLFTSEGDGTWLYHANGREAPKEAEEELPLEEASQFALTRDGA